MIEYKKGSILDSKAQIIVNPVNCVGVQGAGLALAFKNKYPETFKKYKNMCDRKLLSPGKLYLTDNILHFPTKDNWKDNSKIEYIKAGLEKFKNTYKEKGIESIAFPQLGCGKGKLKWKEIKPLMEEYLNLDILVEIWIFEE